MKRVIGIVVAVVLVFASVGYAAETVVPTLTDVYKAIQELKADVAQLKADGFTKANSSGKLATVSTKDGLVTVEVTSLMAGPDATVIGVRITNKTADAEVRFSTAGLSIVAAGQDVKVMEVEGFLDEVLPTTTRQGVILAAPLPKGAKELTFRFSAYDYKTYTDLLKPTLTIPIK